MIDKVEFYYYQFRKKYISILQFFAFDAMLNC